MVKTKSKAKQTKTFLKKGLLDGQIKNRHKAREFKQKVQGRKVKRNRNVNGAKGNPEEEELESDVDAAAPMPGSDISDSDTDAEPEDDVDEDHAGDSELEDDDLSGMSDIDGPTSNEQHVEDLKALAEKDPEFFKYLQENDAELLDFGMHAAKDIENEGEGDGEEEDDAEEDDGESSDVESHISPKSSKGKEKRVEERAVPTLTLAILKKWQKNILATRSLRSLRSLLLAFKSAAYTGTDSSNGNRWEIRDASVYNKVVFTTLKYTPHVLIKHCPYKQVNGKFKLNTSSKPYATTQRLIKSFFASLQALLGSVSKDSGITSLAISESAKLIPWIVGNRKTARGWTKVLLAQYDSGSDEVRIASFIALRKLAIAADQSLRESVVKGVYAGLLAASRTTSIYTLPTLTLMKNSATQLFLLSGKQEGEMAYQLAFGYIRMLVILLRKGVKEGSKDAFKSVYNWQFVHAIDFWSLVLSASCDKERVAQHGESPLQQLIYPLVQTALGAIRLVPTSRYYPFRFHLMTSLLRIVQLTGVYIPLATPLFEVLDSPDLSKRSKPSTLKPLDWDYYLKCPSSYQKTRVYADGLCEESIHLLTQYYGSMATSIAFPELTLPAILALRRHSKKSGQAKLVNQIKRLVERLEAHTKWIEERRETIDFAPQKRDKVDRFLQGEDICNTPLGGHLKLMKRLRDQKRDTLEKAALMDTDDT